MYYSASTGSFYRAEIHGTAMPDDVVEITVERHAELLAGQSEGCSIVSDENGCPILQVSSAATPTMKEVECARLRAYADPLTGSDRYFAEAMRMQAMGEEGWEAVCNAGVIRYQEIQEQFPWPEA